MVIVWKLISQNEIHPKVILSISTIVPIKNPELPLEKIIWKTRNYTKQSSNAAGNVIGYYKTIEKKEDSNFKNTEIQATDKGEVIQNTIKRPTGPVTFIPWCQLQGDA